MSQFEEPAIKRIIKNINDMKVNRKRVLIVGLTVKKNLFSKFTRKAFAKDVFMKIIEKDLKEYEF